jgi:hypothetical protein|tara:strand:- start:4927 stop:5271 length:345 start_codon:yes stop_codon:yes gene_type:complete
MSRIPSPTGQSRACLCPDGTYSRKCCDGSLQAQGIGNITKVSVTRYYTAINCSGGTKHIHTHDIELTVGNIYYLTFVHHNHTDCYTITATRDSGKFEVSSVSAYSDCNACIAAN